MRRPDGKSGLTLPDPTVTFTGRTLMKKYIKLPPTFQDRYKASRRTGMASHVRYRNLRQNQSRCVLFNSLQGRRSLMVASTLHHGFETQQLWFRWRSVPSGFSTVKTVLSPASTARLRSLRHSARGLFPSNCVKALRAIPAGRQI
jgi:hypothetical protein